MQQVLLFIPGRPLSTRRVVNNIICILMIAVWTTVSARHGALALRMEKCAFASTLTGRRNGWSCRYHCQPASVKTRLSFLRPATTRTVTCRWTSSSSSSSSSSSDSNDVSNSDRLVAKQKATSQQQRQRQKLQENATAPTTAFLSSQAEHVQHQQAVFDEMVDFFQEEIPDDLVPVYQYLANEILSKTLEQRQQQMQQQQRALSKENDIGNSTDDSYSSTRLKILDVACGTGVLFDYLTQAGDARNINLEITGVDLSPVMIQQAQHRIDRLLSKKSTDRHTCSMTVQASDILEYQPAPITDNERGNDNDTYYDAIIANACFGNFWNATAVLGHMCPWLSAEKGGCIFVTHPLGAAFVAQLHQQDPSTVPHLLPVNGEEWSSQHTRYLPLQLLEPVVHEIELPDTKTVPFYMATLLRVRHMALRQVIRLRGAVDAGYGRGGKKLGFPTANLPSRLFQDALQGVPTGVYFGWALLEQAKDDDDTGSKTGRNVCHKAVVNVGYSPTFEGQENKEKIVEAHLILEEPIDDFYGETMRLQLHGFLRPEIKFPSFPALVAQIGADRDEAKMALDLEPYHGLRQDPFLSPAKKAWVGSSGGDENASWEFQNTDETIDELTATS